MRPHVSTLTFTGGADMLILPKKNPVSYELCNQTVTVYHQIKDEKGKVTGYTRTVHNRAFMDFKKTQNVDKTGSSEVNSFLLIIPGSVQSVFVGDKVYLGIGPDVTDSKGWAALMPSTLAGLEVVRSADPKYWQGQIVHTEAGG